MTLQETCGCPSMALLTTLPTGFHSIQVEPWFLSTQLERMHRGLSQPIIRLGFAGNCLPSASDQWRTDQPRGTRSRVLSRRPLNVYCRHAGELKVVKLQAAADFDALTQQVEDLGLLRVRFAPYISLAAFLAALLAAAVWCAAHARAVSAALLIALFWQQAAFIGHDVGHSAVTHVRAVDSVIGLIIQACVGIGLSW